MNSDSKQIILKKIICLFNYFYSIAIVFSHVYGYIICGFGSLLLPFKSREVIKCNIVKLLLLFLIYGLVISFFSKNPNIGYFTTFCYFTHWLLPFYIGYILSEREKIQKVFLLYYSVFAILTLLSIFAYLGLFWKKLGPFYLVEKGLLKGLRHHIGFAALLSNTMMISFSIAQSVYVFSKIARLSFFVIGVIYLLGIVLTGARSYYIATAFSIFSFLIWFSIDKRRYYLTILLLLAFISNIFISYNFFPTVRQRVNSAFSGNDRNVNERIALYKVALLEIKDNVLFGVGPGQAALQKEYFEKVHLNFYNPDSTQRHLHLHSFYLNLMAEFGLCGFAIFAYIIVQIFSRLIKITNRENNFFKALSSGMIFGLIAILIGEFFDTHLRGPGVAMEVLWLLGMIFGLKYENNKI